MTNSEAIRMLMNVRDTYEERLRLHNEWLHEKGLLGEYQMWQQEQISNNNETVSANQRKG